RTDIPVARTPAGPGVLLPARRPRRRSAGSSRGSPPCCAGSACSRRRWSRASSVSSRFAPFERLSRRGRSGAGDRSRARRCCPALARTALARAAARRHRSRRRGRDPPARRATARRTRARSSRPSLATAVQSLAELRNELGLGHGKTKPSPAFARHARLAFNASRAVVEFLLETWHVRRDQEAGTPAAPTT